jgi:hypothetical protein
MTSRVAMTPGNMQQQYASGSARGSGVSQTSAPHNRREHIHGRSNTVYTSIISDRWLIMVPWRTANYWICPVPSFESLQALPQCPTSATSFPLWYSQTSSYDLGQKSGANQRGANHHGAGPIRSSTTSPANDHKNRRVNAGPSRVMEAKPPQQSTRQQARARQYHES